MQVPIVTNKDTGMLKALLEQVYLDQDLTQILSECEVEKVLVSSRKKEWRIFLNCPSFISFDKLKQLTKNVLSAIPGLKNLVFVPNFQNAGVSVTDFVQCYSHYITELLYEHTPAVSEWLNSARWEVQDETIIIFSPNFVVTGYLQQRNCLIQLKKIIHKMMGKSIEVKLVTDESINEASSPNQELEEKIEYKLQNLKPSRAAFCSTDKQIIGKKITSEVTLIKDIVEEEKSVTVRGRVFNYQVKELKSGRNLVIFDFTDNTSAITVKLFENEKNKGFSERLKNNQWLLIRGSVQQDNYSRELTLQAYDISLIEPDIKEDTSPKKRVELHLHTKMSAMDGITDTAKCVQRAAQWGHPAIAITDHGVVQAFPEAYDAGQKYNIKIIYGVEGYLFDKKENEAEKEKTYHIILLVENQKGLENLYRLISISHLQYFYRKPRIPRDLLEQYREGLIIGSACEAGELIQSILKGKEMEDLLKIAAFYDYLEIQPIGNNEFLLRKGIVDSVEDLRDINRKIIKLGEKLGKPVIATGDVHFLNPEDAVYRRILMCGQGYDDEPQAPLYFRTTEEMLEEFAYLPAEVAEEVVITNPQKIADKIEDVLPIPKELYAPEIPGAEEQIESMSWNKAKEIYGEDLPKVVKDRLNKELHSIINNGFAVLYLIAQKLVKKSNDDGYLVGSRGSVGSSFVATMTGITEVNPLPPHYICPQCKNSEFIEDGSYNCGVDLPDKVCPKCGTQYKKDGHDIPFETFLGFKGDKVPDIDLNFSGDYQPRAHKFTEELFGKDYVFRAGTIATIAEKTAYGFVKNYFEEKNYQPRNAEIAMLVAGFTGVKRTTGQHPGGLMVVPKSTDIHKFTPIQRPADDVKSDTITTHFDYHSISSRLVKLDILGHDDPTVIKMLEDLTGVDAKNISLDEEKTMSLFSSLDALGIKPEDIGSSVGTLGIPEFGTRFVRQMLEDTKPKTFSELVRISGFSHGTDVWLNNAQNLIKSGTAKLSEAISTRDDIMLYLIYRGMEPGTAFKIMEDVRKGKGVKPEYEEEMRKHSIPSWYIESCKKIKYMFPKAHAVAYVTMAFRIAYFKVYYPQAFYATFFTVRADEFDAGLITQGAKRVKEAIQDIEKKGNEASAKEKNLLTILEISLEMFLRGIKLRKVDLWDSEATNFKIIDGEILPPFASLQGLGQTAAENIAVARQEKKFSSIEDLRVRSKLSKTVIEILRDHGCLRGLSETGQLSFF
ncbi:PolC-type DNA polymerase III [Bacillota bacterium LX-D]|nr:PolC-type DNA polymerase III [Bacillota bacterium LX-D]